MRDELLDCALMILGDQCPPEPQMQLCRMQEDDEDDTACRCCWQQYLFWVVNGRRGDPYRHDRLYEGGMVG